MWGRLFAHIATATGWTFREVRRLTMFEVSDLTRYWRVHPPAHIAAAGYSGASETTEDDPKGIGALLGAIKSGVLRGS